jgi:hypothetical protein
MDKQVNRPQTLPAPLGDKFFKIAFQNCIVLYERCYSFNKGLMSRCRYRISILARSCHGHCILGNLQFMLKPAYLVFITGKLVKKKSSFI